MTSRHMPKKEADSDQKPPVTWIEVLGARWPVARPFLAVALMAIVAGGFIAAGTAHAPSRLFVWMVAYLVLVAGVAQLMLGLGQALLAAHSPTRARILLECVVFNAGNAAVIAGVLVDRLIVVAAGEVLFAAALMLFLISTRAATQRSLLMTYRALAGMLFIGAAVGLSLAAQ